MGNFLSTTTILNNVYSGGTLGTIQSTAEVFNAIYDTSANALKVNITGFSGSTISGTSGTSGIDGTSGTDGIDGTDGTSGTSGTDGASGTLDITIADKAILYNDNGNITGRTSLGIGSGTNAVSIGASSTASATDSITIGANNTNSATETQVVGFNNVISVSNGGGYSTVIGQGNTLAVDGNSYAEYGTFIGYNLGDGGGETNIAIGLGQKAEYLGTEKAFNFNGKQNIHIGVNPYNDTPVTRAGNSNKTFSDNLATAANTTNITVLGGYGASLSATSGTTWINPRGTYSGYEGGEVIIDGKTYFLSDVKISGKLTSDIEVKSYTGDTYSIVLDDCSSYIRLSDVSGVTITVPTNATLSFPIGTIITFEQAGAGPLSITSTETLYGNVNTDTQFEIIQIIKVDTTAWSVIGGKV